MELEGSVPSPEGNPGTAFALIVITSANQKPHCLFNSFHTLLLAGLSTRVDFPENLEWTIFRNKLGPDLSMFYILLYMQHK